MESKKSHGEKRKPVVDFRINESTMTDSANPVDLSFFKYKDLHPVGCESARITRLGGLPERGKEKNKYLSKGVWLNNNNLTSIKNLEALVNSVLENSEALSWIDFSYNYITEIDEVILKFKNLSIINFHGNKISEITEVAKLRGLKKLRNVTFHGNPISKDSDYRTMVIGFLPTIVHLDFHPVVKSERTAPLHPNSIRHIKQMTKVKKTKSVPPPSAPKDEKKVERAVNAVKTEEVIVIPEVSSYSQKVDKTTQEPNVKEESESECLQNQKLLESTEGHEQSKRRPCECSKYFKVNLFA